MSYLGYLVNINGVTIDPKIIVPKTYNAASDSRLINKILDANGDEHIKEYPNEKTEIKFVIQERTEVQQAQIADIFKTRRNLQVVWYDLVSTEYKTGKFYMEKPTFVLNAATDKAVYYADTEIVLKEY